MEHLEAVTRLAPIIREAASNIERDRLLPNVLFDQMADADLFRLWLPKSLGGPEASFATAFRTVEALAALDGSVGWCSALGIAYSRYGGILPQSIAAQIFEPRSTVAGALPVRGKAIIQNDRYRVNGRWPWGSGISHSNWVLASCLTYKNDGEQIMNGDGTPAVTLVFLPKQQVEVVDTWNSTGLRGTGSHDYQINDALVSSEYTLPGVDSPPRELGPLYTTSINSVYPFILGAVTSGIGLSAIDSFIELAGTKAPLSAGGQLLLRDKGAVHAMLGRVEALLSSARSYALTTAEEAWEWAAAGDPLTIKQRAQIRSSIAQITEAAKTVVRNLYDAASGSSVYEPHPFGRKLRDVSTASQHIQVHPDNFESAGRTMLGLPPLTPRF